MQPAADEIRSHLGRVLASEPFAASDRLSRFLRYVVERSLAGEGDRLKEYVIGTEVFDRGEQYDPRLDSIVRVEAGRLRAKLDEYYARQGAADAVIIQMPRGRYAPTFQRRPVPASAGTPIRRRIAAGVATALLLTGLIAWAASRRAPAETRTAAINAGVSIAVLPFKHYSTEERDALLAARLTDGVTSELARLGTLQVVSHTTARQYAAAQRPLREIAGDLGAHVVMEGSVTAAHGRVEVEARLVSAALDRKFWVERFFGDINRVDELQRRIAEAAAPAAAKVPR